MKNIIKYTNKILLSTVLLSIALYSLISCNKIDEPGVANSGAADVETVDCALSLVVEDMVVAADGIAKSVSYEPTEDECAINNIVILQYNASGKLVGIPLYYDNLDSKTSSQDSYEFTSVPMLDSKNDEGNYEEHTVVLIANSFLSDIETNSQLRENIASFEQLKAFMYAYNLDGGADQRSSCFRKDETTGKEYFTMSSMNKTVVQSVTPIEAKLKRNVAKIVVTVDNSNGELTGAKIRLADMPSLTPYFTNYSKADTYPTLDSFTEVESSEQTVDEGVKEYVFYMPANVRGAIDELGVKDENIPLFAKLNSTFVKITKNLLNDDGSESPKTVECKIYLVERDDDGTIRFDIKENHQYNCEIIATEVSEESAKYDSRVSVDNQTVIDHTTERASNCYMLHPNENYDVEYYIPVFQRINEFWGNQGYEDVPENLINPLKGDQFSVELAWHDFNLNAYKGQKFDEISNIVSFSTMSETSPSGTESLKLTLKKESFGKEGNVLINIVKNHKVVWSWHFWITSYNPNSVATYKNKYVSEVENGEIRRFGGDFWRDKLAGKYIMDRCIGSSSNTDNYVMYYQWGRKDPFVVNTTNRDNNEYFYILPRTFDAESVSSLASVKEWVYNPTTFYERYLIGNYTQAFPYEMLYNFGEKLWNDPKLSDVDDYEHSRKSIFDPSPLGWRIPDYETFTHITPLNTRTVVDADTLLGYGRKNYRRRLYNPTATDNSQVTRENSIADFYGTVYISHIGTKPDLYYSSALYLWTNYPNTTSTTARYAFIIATASETLGYNSDEIQNAEAIMPIME